MLRMYRGVLALLVMVMLTGCSQNYSNGERVGLVTQFSNTGLWWKSWEGHLNMTQTGMNSSQAFDFSIDNDATVDAVVIARLDSAAKFGWKVKLVYHQVQGYNWFANRGHTSYFVNSVEVLDRDAAHPFGNLSAPAVSVSGKTVDTVFVVIVGRSSEGYKR